MQKICCRLKEQFIRALLRQAKVPLNLPLDSTLHSLAPHWKTWQISFTKSFSCLLKFHKIIEFMDLFVLKKTEKYSTNLPN